MLATFLGPLLLLAPFPLPLLLWYERRFVFAGLRVVAEVVWFRQNRSQESDVKLTNFMHMLSMRAQVK